MTQFKTLTFLLVIALLPSLAMAEITSSTFTCNADGTSSVSIVDDDFRGQEVTAVGDCNVDDDTCEAAFLLSQVPGATLAAWDCVNIDTNDCECSTGVTESFGVAVEDGNMTTANYLKVVQAQSLLSDDTNPCADSNFDGEFNYNTSTGDWNVEAHVIGRTWGSGADDPVDSYSEHWINC